MEFISKIFSSEVIDFPERRIGIKIQRLKLFLMTHPIHIIGV